MYTHVLFDLDGTLVDTLPLIEHTYSTLFSRHPEYGVVGQDAVKLLGMSLTSILSQLVPADNVQDMADEYMTIYREHHDDMLKPYPGILEAVSGIVQVGVVVGVVTSKMRETTERALRDLDLLELMDVIVASEDVKRHKPDAEPVLAAMRKLGCSSKGTVYIGDSPFDMMAGKAAGTDVIGVTWGAFDRGELEALEPNHIVESPSALYSVLVS